VRGLDAPGADGAGRGLELAPGLLAHDAAQPYPELLEYTAVRPCLEVGEDGRFRREVVRQ